MKNITLKITMRHTARILAVSVLFLLSSTKVSAQFGISVIDNVVDAAAGMVGANKGNHPGGGNNNNNGGNSGSRAGGNKGSADPGHGTGAGPWKPVPKIVFTDKDFCWECVSPSYDGVFSVRVGYKEMYRFYETDGGKPISRSTWKSSGEPRFNKGVCAVQSVKTRQWFILKKNGDSIALDPKIRLMTNFVDGVAIAGDYSVRYFINDKGQKIYPNVKPSEFEIYPLVDGTRRMFKASEGYGYLDAHGNVVIKPQYSEARSFSGGVAIVYDMSATENKYWIIDNMGKKVCEVPSKYAKISWTKSCNLSDFVNGAAVARNSETDKYDIVSTKMDIKASFDDASPFCLKTTPASASVCIVKNKDWEHPQFCNAHGTVLDQYNNPMVLLKRPTQPFYETSNEKGEKTVRLPTVFAGYNGKDLYTVVKEAFALPSWEYTGLNVVKGSATNDLGYIIDYEGVLGTFNYNYTKLDDFSTDRIAKANMKSTKEWKKPVDRWMEVTEDHMVFVDASGKILVELVHQPE